MMDLLNVVTLLTGYLPSLRLLLVDPKDPEFQNLPVEKHDNVNGLEQVQNYHFPREIRIQRKLKLARMKSVQHNCDDPVVWLMAIMPNNQRTIQSMVTYNSG